MQLKAAENRLLLRNKKAKNDVRATVLHNAPIIINGRQNTMVCFCCTGRRKQLWQ